MDTTTIHDADADLLHYLGSKIATSNQDPLHEVLQCVLEFAVALVKCDSCAWKPPTPSCRSAWKPASSSNTR